MIGYIYRTTNLINNKIYIGQHVATKFEPERYIGSGTYFLTAVKKYGKNSFKCELICWCETIEKLNEQEKYYIALYRATDPLIGYNIADGGEEPWNRGRKMTDIYCKKDSEAQRSIAPKINMYKLETGELVAVFNSSIDAADYILNTSSDTSVRVKTIASRICTVCLAGKGHAYGYIWRYNKNYSNIKILETDELKAELISPRARKIGKYSLDNILIETYESAAQYSKLVATDYSRQRKIAKSITNCCNGKAKTFHKFIWKYID